MPEIIDLKNRQKQVQPKPQIKTAPVKPAVTTPSPVVPSVNVNPELPILSPPPVQEVKKKPADVQVSWNAHLQQSIRHPRMLWLLGICAVAGLVIAKFLSSILLLVLIGIATVITLIQRTRPVRPSAIVINHGGISIDGKTKYWREMKSFWLEYNPGSLKELSIQPSRFGLPYLKIPLEDTDPMEVRNALIAYLPEEEHELSVVEAFLKNR